jgi:hypothetical protein
MEEFSSFALLLLSAGLSMDLRTVLYFASILRGRRFKLRGNQNYIVSWIFKYSYLFYTADLPVSGFLREALRFIFHLSLSHRYNKMDFQVTIFIQSNFPSEFIL